MKTEELIRAGIKARTEGLNASKQNLKIDANPYPEADELHWRWLDSWCVAESEKNKSNRKKP